jgi:excinuclease ABC subunit B
VSLVAVLDADKEGFLRSAGSLIQTMGRAARNVRGRAILYAERMTASMQAAIAETLRRREIQERYNSEHGITPETILKPIDASLVEVCEVDYHDIDSEPPERPKGLETGRFESVEDMEKEIRRLEKRMKKAAEKLDFEEAASFRDQIAWLRRQVVFS